ncbi:unnamed protein product [Hyaloperonospora brassicae]|uniref:Uncharacterized protein n=1 Tax=Hyaloperonospora brassicae TaxID=162125 RepID=A0AAV0TY44_HYABA|nr:unnamed protein product [Hyaloperonospora brassicae]CAI5727744.1 unnamed protein product [Hyaloperonospora brassicae]CAI5728810.1 unnamed protein product [Hyaloperonospora brassicae]
MAVVLAVEKSLLRTLAFVLYQVDRSCAKYCASSVVQWYVALQTRLPVAALDSLDRVAESVIALSDDQFTDFWTSLVANEPLDEAPHERHCLSRGDDCCTYSNDDHEQDREQHLVQRFYQRLFAGLQRMFFAADATEKGQTQTPCTSPVDLLDSSHRLVQHSGAARCLQGDADYEAEGRRGETGRRRSDEVFEPGWAVEYMEQDSSMPSEMSRRMAKMMHSNVAANLFRATVTLGGCEDEDRDMENYYMDDAVTPGSFPPTPITRDLQTRRMNRYTVTVLDHATLTLRLLTEENYSC